MDKKVIFNGLVAICFHNHFSLTIMCCNINNFLCKNLASLKNDRNSIATQQQPININFAPLC